MFITLEIAAMVLAAALLGLFVVRWLVDKANQIQKWRREVAELSAMFAKHGYTKLGKFLSYFFSRDYAGGIAYARFLSKTLREAKDSEALFLEWTAEAWKYELPLRLKDPELLALVQEAVTVQTTKK